MQDAVLFRVDASAEVGIGHLRRCLSLAAALRLEGTPSQFVVGGPADSVAFAQAHGVTARGIESTSLWSERDLAETMAEARANRCTAVVVDSDAKHEWYLDWLRQAGWFVCAVDDGALQSFPCQLVVNGDAHATRLVYRSASGDTRFLLGPRYALLREEFWETPPRTWRDEVRRVLVTLGGADRFGLMPRLLRLLDDLTGAFEVTAVVGPFFANVEEVASAADHSRRRVDVVRTPASVRDLMLGADLAISAAGQTLYELACTGCPAVAVIMAENQVEQVRACAEADIVFPAGVVHDAAVLDTVASAVTHLLSNPGVRRAMSEAGRRMVDGRGALRVARAILAGPDVIPEEGAVPE